MIIIIVHTYTYINITAHVADHALVPETALRQ